MVLFLRVYISLLELLKILGIFEHIFINTCKHNYNCLNSCLLIWCVYHLGFMFIDFFFSLREGHILFFFYMLNHFGIYPQIFFICYINSELWNILLKKMIFLNEHAANLSKIKLKPPSSSGKPNFKSVIFTSAMLLGVFPVYPWSGDIQT